MDERVQRDFPIDWEEDHYVSRREFFKFLTLASGGLAVGSGALAAWTSFSRRERKFEPVPIAGAENLDPGASMPFDFPRKGDLCLLIRRPDGAYVAYSRRCTHLSCPVQYEPSHERLYCPCHNGAFAVEDGRVLQGPPPHPLPRIKLEVRERTVWATGVALPRENA